MTQRQIIEQNNRDLEAKFNEAFRKYHIGKTQRLKGSTMVRSEGSGDEVSSTIIKYLMYGKYVDMGVGRGMRGGNTEHRQRRQYGAGKKAEHKAAGGKGWERTAKPWYSRPVSWYTKRTAERLADYYGRSAQEILKSIPQIIDMGAM